jgi:hypothetical protein
VYLRNVRILGYQPTRRRWLQTLALAAAGAPLVKLGRVLERRKRTRRPEDLAPIPWIGHC